MAALTINQLLDTVNRQGLRYEIESGAANRGFAGLDPVGVMNHHTAALSRLDLPSRGTVRDGRSDLDGPLCNWLVGRSGLCVLIAVHKAQHAGKGHRSVLEAVTNGRPVPDVNGPDQIGGNGLFYGIEIENDGRGEPYPPAQLDAVVRLNAALCIAHRWNQHHCIHHRMWTDRKIDMSYHGDLLTPIAMRILGGSGPVSPMPILPQYDPGKPAAIAYEGSPEENFLRAYLGGSTTAHSQRPDYAFSQYQIIVIPRDHSWLPNPLPPYSVGFGTRVPGWGQVSGADRFETLRMMINFLGLPVL